MRTTLLIIGFSLLSGLLASVHAQTTKADSLKALLPAAKGQGYVDLLNQIGEATYERQPDTAFLYATKASQLAKLQNYKLGQADAERVLGYYYITKGELDRALQSLSNALPFYDEIANTRGSALCNKGLGIIYFKRGNYAKAIEYNDKTIEQAKSLKDDLLVANIQNNNASIYYKTKNFEKALESYTAIQKYYESVEDSFKLAITLSNIGTTYMNLDDPTSFSKGVSFLLKSIQMRRMIGDKAGLAGSYYNLAYVYINRGDFPKGISYMEQTLSTYNELGNKERVAFATYSLGEIYQKAVNIENHLAKAKEYTEKALQMATEGNYKATEIKCKVNLCYIIERQGNFVAADKAFSEAHALLVKVGDSSQAANVLIRGAMMQDTIADGLIAAKKYSEAIPYLEKSANTFAKFDKKEKLVNSYKLLSELYRKTGKKEESAAFAALYNETKLKLANEIKQEEEARMAAAQAAEAEAAAKERARREAERQDRRQEEDDEEEEEEE